MTLRPLPLSGALARGLGHGARAALRHAALMTAAAVMGAVGCGWLMFAVFAALRLWIGPELAALGIGNALLVLAVLLGLFAQGPRVRAANPPDAAAPPPRLALPPTPIDPATLAVFTAAFVLGRRLANRPGR